MSTHEAALARRYIAQLPHRSDVHRLEGIAVQARRPLRIQSALLRSAVHVQVVVVEANPPPLTVGGPGMDTGPARLAEQLDEDGRHAGVGDKGTKGRAPVGEAVALRLPQVRRNEPHGEEVGALVEIAELDVVIDQAVERLQLVRAEDARQHAVPGEPRQGGGGRGG